MLQYTVERQDVGLEVEAQAQLRLCNAIQKDDIVQERKHRKEVKNDKH